MLRIYGGSRWGYGAGAVLLCAFITGLLVWKPWVSGAALSGWKPADEEMRVLLESQRELREAGKGQKPEARKEEGGAKKPAASGTAAPAPPQAGPEPGAPPGAGESTASAADNGPHAAPGHKKAAPGAAGAKLDLNRATAAQLEELPGIGPSRAQAILELRSRLGGRFKQVEQLLEVKGIGDKMLAKLKPYVTVDPNP
ncbi:helix-hairpin-helix domain-containing protein [Paenibacillus filicis]|uniref:Helix-hairpin-helix domain-containing protein n=1 Tax=Paenibacillus gyeongsangnamensis TaxID=3388067 RepID=A0ABT4Q2Y9_9BACL|nr:helix-hairpin-helix domain-containing protein [Paenibacillus filicis]MCZ8511132.1 helix-hairpin-helix domain-containing protein [Paenibacillus filicis]